MVETQPALTRNPDVLRGWIGGTETSSDLINA
jgi:hypothetical protein